MDNGATSTKQTAEKLSIIGTVPYSFDDIHNDIEVMFNERGYDTAYGSNITQLINSMAYAVSMLNVNTAANINEMILPYANRRRSILSLARNLGYEATKKTSYVYSLALRSKSSTFILPKFTTFTCGDHTYVYMGKQIEKNNVQEDDIFNVLVTEGTIYQYSDSEALHINIGRRTDESGARVTQNYVDVPFVDVEENGIEVLCTYVDEFGTLHDKEVWTQAPSLYVEIDQDNDRHEFFRIDNVEFGTPRIYFRYNGIGNGVPVGTEVRLNVLVSSGAAGKCDTRDAKAMTCPDKDIECTMITLFRAGSDEETDNSVKTNAPLLHNSANRMVVSADYVAACNRDVRVRNSIVWGGESEFPKSPGHIWFSFLPKGSHSFTINEAFTQWTRDDITYKWDYTAEPETLEAMKSERNDFFLINYIPEYNIRSPYRNADGTTSNPGIWDKLDSLKIPTLTYHNRSPIYLVFTYDIEIMKYLNADTRKSVHTDLFNLIDKMFHDKDTINYENFDVEYFNTNVIKRLNERVTDDYGFNLNTEQHLLLNSKTLCTENPVAEYKDIFIPLALPYETYFDDYGFLMIDRLPSIDTKDFVTYREDDVKGTIYTDWKLVRNDIANGRRQVIHKMIYAPIMVHFETAFPFKERTHAAKVMVPFEIQPDDYLSEVENAESSALVFDNTTVVLSTPGTEDIVLEYNVDWFWNYENPTVIRLAGTVQPSEESVLLVSTETQAGWYYVFNSLRKEIMIHLFVDGTKKGFPISLGGDWSKDPEANSVGRYLFSYDDYYVYTNNDNYLVTESQLKVRNSYVETTKTQPRSFLTSTDGSVLVTMDKWYLTTNGYVIMDESEQDGYSGPIIRECSKYMYTHSPLKIDLFDANRYLNLRYMSNNFSVIRNVMPLLGTVHFFTRAGLDGTKEEPIIKPYEPVAPTDPDSDPEKPQVRVTVHGDETTVIVVNQNTPWKRLLRKIDHGKKEGYRFDHWSSTDPSEEDTPIKSNAVVYVDLDVFPVWIKTWFVVVDTLGGFPKPGTRYYDDGTPVLDIVDALPRVTKTGYNLVHWSVDPEGDAVAHEILHENIHLYAVYEEAKAICKVTVHNNGVTTTKECTTNTMWREFINELRPATKEGYRFKGWSMTEDGGPIDLDYIITTSIEIYSTYVKQHLITFETGTDSVKVDPKHIDDGFEWERILNTLHNVSRDGYRLDRWSLSQEGDAVSGTVQQDCTLYAVWVKVWTVRFVTDGGEPIPKDLVVDDGTRWSKIHREVIDPTRPAFLFEWWSTAPQGKAVSDFPVQSDVTLYAVWKKAPHTCTIMIHTTPDHVKVVRKVVPEGTRWDEINDVLYEADDGHEFVRWSLEPDGPEIDLSYEFNEVSINVYAVFRVVCNIHFETGTETVLKDVKTYPGVLWDSVLSGVDAGVRDGYRFSHWSLESGGSLVSGSVPSHDCTLYAVWVKVWTVHFDPNGGTPTPPDETVDHGTTWGVLKERVTEPKLKGMRLVGWELLSDCTVHFVTGTDAVVEDIETYAGANWGNVLEGIDGGLRDGYRFSHWSLDRDGVAVEGIVPESSDITLYAVWVKVHTLNFDSKGGTPETFSVSVDDGEKWKDVKKRVDAPTKEGMILAGWNLKA